MRLEFSPNALRGLRHLPARDAAQLVAKINRFATDPFGRWPWAKGFGDGRGRIR